MFGCILGNTIENTFSTCCLHFLTFSQLPNKYIISFLSPQTQKKQNPKKKFIKSGQIEEEGRERGDWVRSRGEIARRWSRSLLDWCGAVIDEIGAIFA